MKDRLFLFGMFIVVSLMSMMYVMLLDITNTMDDFSEAQAQDNPVLRSYGAMDEGNTIIKLEQ